MIKSILQKVIMIAIVFAIGSHVNAQENDKDKPAKIGIRAGWNYAAMFIDGDQLSGTDRMNSFYVGLFKEKKIVPLLRFGSGLEYFKNGYTINDNLKRELHYLSVPLYLKVKLAFLYATGGTALNFRVSEKLPGNVLLDPLNNEQTAWFDMPLQLGLGVKILMFSVEARYNWGLFDMYNDSRNQYFQAGFTVSF